MPETELCLSKDRPARHGMAEPAGLHRGSPASDPRQRLVQMPWAPETSIRCALTQGRSARP